MVETHGYTLEEIANVFDSKDDLTMVNTLEAGGVEQDVVSGKGDDRKTPVVRHMHVQSAYMALRADILGAQEYLPNSLSVVFDSASMELARYGTTVHRFGP
ncbi:hypothetical protein BDY19DRAFT_998966 [Irpex rosettiformis]|uniref:Uncharacterized protein n=1 Tax=Irpex rosettiformis TaxID=378272 RepID=A0ACB8TLV5_9APHY|nr:hypothetical protein BDY19DRAFT_998966 [Irpex rosettiformis]